jgi:hypothetical protein
MENPAPESFSGPTGCTACEIAGFEDREKIMKFRTTSLAVLLIGCFSSAGSAETPTERGSYLVNTIGACGNCHARDTVFNRTPDLAGGATEDREVGNVVTSNITPAALANGLKRRSSWPYATANVQTGR